MCYAYSNIYIHLSPYIYIDRYGGGGGATCAVLTIYMYGLCVTVVFVLQITLLPPTPLTE